MNIILEKLKQSVETKNSFIMKHEEAMDILVALGEMTIVETPRAIQEEKEIVRKEIEHKFKELSVETFKEHLLDFSCKLGDRLRIIRQQYQMDMLRLSVILDVPLYLMTKLEKCERIEDSYEIRQLAVKLGVTQDLIKENVKRRR